MRILDITTIKQLNKDAGRYFFGPSAMYMFKSYIFPDTNNQQNGVYFITRERSFPKETRYSIRVYNRTNCTISQVLRAPTLEYCRKFLKDISEFFDTAWYLPEEELQKHAKVQISSGLGEDDSFCGTCVKITNLKNKDIIL